MNYRNKFAMKSKRLSPFDIKRSDETLTALGQFVFGCHEINLDHPLFIVSTKVIKGEIYEFIQQFLTFDEEKLSELLDELGDEKKERRVYVVSAIDQEPSNGLKFDRLREVWCANDARYPLIATIIYVLDDGHQFIRQIDCPEPVEGLGESRLLLRV